MDETLAEFTGQSCDWYDLPCHASGFATWLLNVLLFVPRKVFELLMEGLAATLNALPVPDAFQSAQSAAGSLAGGVVWMLDLCAFDVTLPLIMSSLLLRFLLRRIPGIG